MKILFPNTVKTQKERFDFLASNKDFLVNQKKSISKNADEFGVSLIEKRFLDDVQAKAYGKSLPADTEDVIYRTIVANTYKWMDSHDDVHIPGLFTKTINENKGNIPHLHDHIYALDAKVGIPSNIYEQIVPWTSLGVNLEGDTTVLLADSAIHKDLNSSIFGQYKRKEISQHSVAMSYVNMFLCINDPSYKEYYDSWNKYIEGIGNMPKVIENGYFWAITEAKLREFSCVFKGSNELTDVYDHNETPEPSNDTQESKNEPPKSTQRPRFDINCI